MRLDRMIAVRNDKTIFCDNEECIKVFHAVYSKSDILNEAHNHARMEDTGLSVPKLLEVKTIDGRWAIVSEYIKGKNLELLMKEEPEKKTEYLEIMITLQLDMFYRDCPPIPRLKDKLNRRIKNAELDATRRFELHSVLNEMPIRRKICHGDFVPSNVIVSKDGVAYLIDFSHVSQGNAEADVARTYLEFLLKKDETSAEYYLERICHKGGFVKEEIMQWIPIVAAAASVDVWGEEREFFLSLAR